MNRQFAVQVTEPSPQSSSVDPRLTLYKWWPGGRATFHIPNSQQWERVKEIVETDLAPHLNWTTVLAVKKAVDAQKKAAGALQTQLKSAAKSDPTIVTQLLKGLKLDRITDDDVQQIADAFGEIAAVLLDADASMRRAITRVVKQLPDQGKDAVDALSDLMEHLTVTQIAAVTNEVRRRVNLIAIFKERINDDRTYEIRGDGSIHRLLEQAMWIVDEHYWLMHSNEQLRTVVGRELAREHEAYKLHRPDFVCGTVDRRLILIEIKRPSHVLTVDDLNQLERYVVICRDYLEDARAPFDAILVGRKASDELRKTLSVRGSAFKVRTYVDLIDDTEKRYKRYLDALDDSGTT